MRIPDHLTCLLRNLYAGQEATVRTGSHTICNRLCGWLQCERPLRSSSFCCLRLLMLSLISCFTLLISWDKTFSVIFTASQSPAFYYRSGKQVPRVMLQAHCTPRPQLRSPTQLDPEGGRPTTHAGQAGPGPSIPGWSRPQPVLHRVCWVNPRPCRERGSTGNQEPGLPS